MNEHKAFFRENPEHKGIVIFIHGFMGSPVHFESIVEKVYSYGFSYSSILLPGHGKNSIEFGKYGLQDWEKALDLEISKYTDTYDKIYLVGHSMGGLLALNASIYEKNHISGIMLLGSPLKVSYFSRRSISNKLKLVFLSKRHIIKTRYLKVDGVAITPAILYPTWIKTVREFYKLMHKALKNLDKVKIPSVLIHSEFDETASLKSIPIFEKGMINCEKTMILLHKSWHAYYTPDEETIIANALFSLLDKND